jgi:hypothetical protein
MVSEGETPDDGTIEIGKVSELSADNLYLWHTRGDALLEARMMKKIMDRYGLTQQDLAKLLREDYDISITQAHISRLLSLLTLEPVFIEMIENKKMAHSTGIKLAKLPPGNRMKILDGIKAEGRDRIYLYDVDSERRASVITQDLLDLVESYDDGVTEPEDAAAHRWWNGLSPKERDKIYQSYISTSRSIEKIPTKRYRKGSKYDVILDEFLKSEFDIVEVTVDGKDGNYIGTQLNSRIESSSKYLGLKSYVVKNIAYLEKV